MSRTTSVLLAGLVFFSMAYPFIGSEELFIEYDVNEANEVWDNYESHVYVKRTTPNSKSIELAENLVEKNEIYLMRYWEVFTFDGELAWDEDPFNDWTWQFYFHSLRMVSHLLNAYEMSSNISYLEKAQWFIESWMEHNPNPRNQASDRAWDDHSTANRISTMIYFWDNYRNSEIYDNVFAVELLNMLRKHGEYTADSDNYYWGHNHGIYQDRALLQLAGMFPIFKDSEEWSRTGNTRLATHIADGVTDSGVHKEHSPAYHYLVMKLFIDVNLFNQHYGIGNHEITDLVYNMQEYLVYIAKQDGTIPMVGDSFNDKVMSMSTEMVTNEHLLYEISNGQNGVAVSVNDIVYTDAGVAVFKNDWDNATPVYFALFNAFHSIVHKQSDDLSFVLSYGNTDYLVDGGKYNFVESDPYRQFIRSVFSHNTISVDNQTYDFRDKDLIGNPVIESFEITENYSFVKASHTIFEGVKITRTAFFFEHGAVYLHDEIESDSSHSYSQIFNFGPEVNIDATESGDLNLSSKVDQTTVRLNQLSGHNGFELFNGSTDPIRGWQSTTFNQVSPINSVSYYLDGDSTSFSTTINLAIDISSIDLVESDGAKLYSFTLSNGLAYEIIV